VAEQTPLSPERLAEIAAHRVLAARHLGVSEGMEAMDAAVFSRALDDSRTLAAQVARLRAVLVARDRRDDEIRALLAETDIPPGDAGADLWAMGMAVLSHLDGPGMPDDWDPEDRVAALRKLTEKLTTRVTDLTEALEGARRTVEEQQVELAQLRPAHRPTGGGRRG